MLATLELTDRKGLLLQIRTRIAELELQNAQWSSSQRASKAILEAFMAKLVGSFNQIIDRVDAAFTARVRIWTAMLSVALVVVLHLDTFALMARLNADSALRDKVVASAVSAMEKGQFAPPPAVPSTRRRCWRVPAPTLPAPAPRAAWMPMPIAWGWPRRQSLSLCLGRTIWTRGPAAGSRSALRRCCSCSA